MYTLMLADLQKLIFISFVQTGYYLEKDGERELKKFMLPTSLNDDDVASGNTNDKIRLNIVFFYYIHMKYFIA